MSDATPAPQPPDAAPPRDGRRWRRTAVLTLSLLGAWLVVTLLATVGAELVDALLPGRHAAFWFGAQGALLLFLAIVGVYIWRMERLEAAAGPDD